MSHDPHLGFIVAAYALALVIVAAMAVAIMTDYWNLQRALSSLSGEAPQDSQPQGADLAPRNSGPGGPA